MSDNLLSTQGAETLRDVLKQNNSLTHLILQGNRFGDSSAPIWADIITVNQYLTIFKISISKKIFSFQNTLRIEYLDLSHNEFGEDSGKIKYIIKFLKLNFTILKLQLTKNRKNPFSSYCGKLKY